MKTKFLFVFALLMTLTGSYKGEAKAAGNFDVTTGLLAFERKVVFPSFPQPPVDVFVTEGQDVSINVQFAGDPTPSAVVSKVVGILTPWVQITNTPGSPVIIKITRVTIADAGKYSVTITNSAGSATTYFSIFVSLAK